MKKCYFVTVKKYDNQGLHSTNSQVIRAVDEVEAAKLAIAFSCPSEVEAGSVYASAKPTEWNDLSFGSLKVQNIQEVTPEDEPTLTKYFHHQQN
jgi:hypothetical protein